jgi:hypothetical protein
MAVRTNNVGPNDVRTKAIMTNAFAPYRLLDQILLNILVKKNIVRTKVYTCWKNYILLKH